MSRGFTVVELMITLFVAALFIISGSQLYQTVVFRSGEARKMSEASAIAYEVLRSEGKYRDVAQLCSVSGAHPQETVNRTSQLLGGRVEVKLQRCRVQPALKMVRVTATVPYDNAAKEVSHAIYATN